MNVEFFEESLFIWLTVIDYSKPIKKMSFCEKATITFQFIDGFMYFNSLFVEPEFQRQGVASKILKELTEQADKYSCKIVLEVVSCGDMSKKQLIKFYESFGFKVKRFGEIPGMEREPTK